MAYMDLSGLNYFYQKIKAKINEAVSSLRSEIESSNNRVTKSTGTVDGLGWSRQSDGTYTQTIAVQGVTASNDILVSPANDYREAYNNMGCEAIEQAENSITLRCTDPDDIDMVIGVIIFNLS